MSYRFSRNMEFSIFVIDFFVQKAIFNAILRLYSTDIRLFHWSFRVCPNSETRSLPSHATNARSSNPATPPHHSTNTQNAHAPHTQPEVQQTTSAPTTFTRPMGLRLNKKYIFHQRDGFLSLGCVECKQHLWGYRGLLWGF